MYHQIGQTLCWLLRNIMLWFKSFLIWAYRPNHVRVDISYWHQKLMILWRERMFINHAVQTAPLLMSYWWLSLSALFSLSNISNTLKKYVTWYSRFRCATKCSSWLIFMLGLPVRIHDIHCKFAQILALKKLPKRSYLSLQNSDC